MQRLNQPMLQQHHFSEPMLYNLYLAHLAGFIDSDHQLRFGTEYNENGHIQPSKHHPVGDMLTVDDFQNENLYFVYSHEMRNVIPTLVHVGPHGYQIQPPHGYYENIAMANRCTPQQWLNAGNTAMQVQNPRPAPIVGQSIMNIQNLNTQQNLPTQLPRIQDTPELLKHFKSKEERKSPTRE